MTTDKPDHFDLEDLGAYELKGFADPVPAWRVLSARDVESRFAATRTGSSAPLVGVSTETACRFEPKSPVGNSEICTGKQRGRVTRLGG